MGLFPKDTTFTISLERGAEKSMKGSSSWLSW
jgi:hypothetical protein